MLLYTPARARATNKIKNIAWLYWRKTGALALAVQSRHEAFENVEGRQPAYAAAVERKQAEASGVQRVGLAVMLDREALRHRGVDRSMSNAQQASIVGERL